MHKVVKNISWLFREFYDEQTNPKTCKPETVVKIPADKVDEYKRTRDSMEKATIKFFKSGMKYPVGAPINKWKNKRPKLKKNLQAQVWISCTVLFPLKDYLIDLIGTKASQLEEVRGQGKNI